MALGLVGCTAPSRLVIADPSGVRVQFVSAKTYPADALSHTGIQAWPVDHSEEARVQVIRIDDEEVLHHHEHHDLFVFLAEGRGIMRLGPLSLPLEKGDAVLIRRGTAHAYRNTNSRGSLAIVVSVPPGSPADRVEESSPKD